MSDFKPGIVFVDINAGTLQPTGNTNPETGTQYRMGNNLYIHITPAQAQQWIIALAGITKEEGK